MFHLPDIGEKIEDGPRRLLGLVLLAVIGISISCTYVEFERSPYAPRGLDVIYSAQEDITFFVWRVGDEVDFDRIEFELLVDGDYRRIDPADAPFSHEPYECDRNYYCVQFQFDGRWSESGDTAAVRAIDELHGTFESTDPRRLDVETTIAIEPIGDENNEVALPELVDWFDDEDVPLRRDFEWGLTPASDDDDRACPIDSPDDWSRLTNRVGLPHGWINTTPCMVVRPDRHDGDPGTEVRAPIVEGPMLYSEDLDRRIPEIQHPIQIAFLVDLQVTNESRCNAYVDSIRDEIFSTLDELDADEDQDRDIDVYDLGTYRPVDPDGTEHSGCQQLSGDRYPVDEIVTNADEQAAALDEKSSLVVVYLNNLDLEPAESKLEDLELLFPDQTEEDDPYHHHWVIGSGTARHLFGWAESTPWAPLEDDNFLPSIETTVERAFPLRSTDFDGEDTVTLHRPNAADSPEFLRVCTLSPIPIGIELPPYDPIAYLGDTWGWPDAGPPRLYFDIPPQWFVRFTSFQERRVVGNYEVCDDFCDHPFPGGDGTIYDSWYDEEDECRWH